MTPPADFKLFKEHQMATQMSGRLPPSITIETLTPAMAQALLDSMVRNRSVRRNHVEGLADAMRRGHFNSLNGETLVVDERGQLVDGQHRLLAFIASGLLQMQFLLVRNVPVGSQDTIDTGKARTPGDVLRMHDHANPHALAAAARWVWVYLNDWPEGLRSRAASKITTAKVREVLALHPELEVAVAECQSLYGTAVKLLTPSVSGFVRLQTDRLSRDDSNEFFAALNTGEGGERTRTVRALRDRLFLRHSKSGRVSPSEVVVFTVRAWNAYRTNRELTKFFVARDLDNPFANVPRFK